MDHYFHHHEKTQCGQFKYASLLANLAQGRSSEAKASANRAGWTSFKRILAAKRLGKRRGLSGQQISKYKSTTDGWRSLPVAPKLLNGMVQSMSRNGNC